MTPEPSHLTPPILWLFVASEAFDSVSLTAHIYGCYPLILKYVAHNLFPFVVLWIVPRAPVRQELHRLATPRGLALGGSRPVQ